jgi:HPt (histidine-containing phosphotransfer) domain-containing protein
MADAVDRTHLDQLAARFGAPFVARLIDLFLAQGRERVAAAEQAAAAGDAAGVAAAAHALKSSAGNVGAAALGERAAEIERAAGGDETPAPLGPMVAALGAEFTAVCERLQTLRAEIGGTGRQPR